MNLKSEQEALRERMKKAKIAEQTRRRLKSAYPRMPARRIQQLVDMRLLFPDDVRITKRKKTYFIRGQLSGLIKIGKSSNPISRLYDLQVGSPDMLELIAVVAGDREQEYHDMFESSRSHGEWFFPEEVLKYLRDQNNINKIPDL